MTVLRTASASGTAFAKDPAWAAIEADSEQDGPIVAGVTSTFMDPASFSPLK